MALLAIRNARLVTETWERPGGIVVGDDGRIEALIGPEVRPEAGTVVDAGGRLLFPGFVDAHVHMRDPGYPHKETFATGTMAAACGGVTTVMCMPNTDPPADSAEGVEAMRAAGEGASLVDFAIQAGVTPDNVADIPALWDMGVTSFEALLSDAPASMLLDSDGLVRAAGAVGACGGVIGVYTGDPALVVAALDRLAGRTDFAAFAEARAPLGEAMGLARLIEAARATKARIVARQVCTARGFAMIEAARGDDPPVSIAAEVTPHHFVSTRVRSNGTGRSPSWFPRCAVPTTVRLPEGLWRRARPISSAPTTRRMRSRKRTSRHPGKSRAVRPGWIPSSPRRSIFAASGEIPWTRVAAVLCSVPARLFGIADRKGRLAVGADGDLVLIDPGLTRTVDTGSIRSRARRSPFEGMTLTGWPVLTALRGRVIAENGRYVGDEPRGRWLRRGAVDWS